MGCEIGKEECVYMVFCIGVCMMIDIGKVGVVVFDL